MAFQRREVAKLAKEMVDITHELGKEAMMFLGDHWLGTEPYMPEFASIGLDAVVGLSLIHISRTRRTTTRKCAAIFWTSCSSA